MSLVNATTTPRLLRLAESGMLGIGSLVTHRTLCFLSSFAFPSLLCLLGAVIACGLSSLSRVLIFPYMPHSPFQSKSDMLMHRGGCLDFPSAEGATAYKTFQAAAHHQALKVAIDFET